MSQNTKPTGIHEKIEHLSNLLDLSSLVEQYSNTDDEIISFYEENDRLYRMYLSEEGFMHFRVSKDGQTFSDDDIYYQPDVVGEFIADGSHVLEIGAGQGSNVFHLAKAYPNAMFSALDLNEFEYIEQLPNVEFICRNCSDLSCFPDDSFDVIFAIESIVYLTDKMPALSEAYRVLKKGGVFIVFDCGLTRQYGEFDEAVRTAISLISGGSAAATIESVEDWRNHLSEAGFHVKCSRDIGKDTLPDLRRLEDRASCALEDLMRSEVNLDTVPKQILADIIVEYLSYDSCKEEIITYIEWVLGK